MDRPKKNFLMRVICISLAFLGHSEAKLPVPPFNAQYLLYSNGINVGQGVIKLSETKENNYQMEMSAEPSGLASIFVSDTFSEIAKGRIEDGRILPEYYERTLHRKDKLQSYSIIKFNWQKKEASFKELTKKQIEKKGSLPITDDVTDTLSLQLIVMRDLTENHKRFTYTFIDDGVLKTYNITYNGEVELMTKLGKKQAIKVTQQRVNSSRKTMFWFDKNNYFIPLQIIQEVNNKESLKTQIVDIKRN